MIASFAFSQENGAKKEKNDKEQTENVEKRSSILFDKLVHDFGTMEKGGDASCVFTFKNVTKKPVTLTNVKTSCGCTAADWPKEPIAKKKKGSIKVKYDSNRIGKFTKTIRVYIDGNENPIQLEIRGTILSPNANDVKTDAPVEKKVEKKIESVDKNLKVVDKEMDKSKEVKSIK
jgi:hypothetical protein